MLHCIVFGREIKVGVSLGEFGCVYLTKQLMLLN